MSVSGSVRGVSFDVGGTLIDPWPSVGHVYAAVAAEHGFHGLDPACLNQRFDAAWKGRERFNYTAADWAGLVDRTFQGLIEPRPSQTFFSALYDRFSEREAWRVYDDVLPTLVALKQHGLKLAIVSNWDDRLEPLLDRLGLAPHFDTLQISCQAGFQKPSAEIFHAALRALALSGEQVLHVGDSLVDDVTGATRAGLHAVRLNRRPSSRRTDEIRSLAELLALLIAPSRAETSG